MSENKLVLDLSVGDDKFEFATSSVDAAIAQAEAELQQISETEESIRALSPDCDKLDYILAASSGALCGMMDIYKQGTSKNTSVVKIGVSAIERVIIWFATRTCPDAHPDNVKEAILALEDKFLIPNEQILVLSDNMNPREKIQQLKSFARNPNLLGLFFSVLDQFVDTARLDSDSVLISIPIMPDPDDPKSPSFLGNVYQGFVEWMKYTISCERAYLESIEAETWGLGIPSPLGTWLKDAAKIIKPKLEPKIHEWEEALEKLARKIFEEYLKDYDFQAQMLQVLLNEMIVRLVYAIRRLIHYLQDTPEEERSFERMWAACEPFSNATVKRMETVAHGTFCLVDTADAAIRASLSSVVGGAPQFAEEFLLRLNIIGLGRFAVSLFGETKRVYDSFLAMGETEFLERKKTIVEDYLEGLKVLQRRYDDARLLDFIEDFKCSSAYEEAFGKSAQLAKLRDVPDDKILKNKADIDKYFSGM